MFVGKGMGVGKSEFEVMWMMEGEIAVVLVPSPVVEAVGLLPELVLAVLLTLVDPEPIAKWL